MCTLHQPPALLPLFPSGKCSSSPPTPKPVGSSLHSLQAGLEEPQGPSFYAAEAAQNPAPSFGKLLPALPLPCYP